MGYPECPCCGGTSRPLTRHHWYEVDGSFHEREVCYRCNVLLHAANFGHFGSEWNHVLPSWDEQVCFVWGYRSVWMRKSEGQKRGECEEFLRSQRPYIASEPVTDLSLLKSWLARSHSGREVKMFGMSEEELIAIVSRRVAELESRLISMG